MEQHRACSIAWINNFRDTTMFQIIRTIFWMIAYHSYSIWNHFKMVELWMLAACKHLSSTTVKVQGKRIFNEIFMILIYLYISTIFSPSKCYVLLRLVVKVMLGNYGCETSPRCAVRRRMNREWTTLQNV